MFSQFPTVEKKRSYKFFTSKKMDKLNIYPFFLCLYQFNFTSYY